jgi:isopenicillin-N epimerase
MARNHALALAARTLLLVSLELEAPCPPGMLGSMASILLPVASPGSPASRLDCAGLHDWFRDRGIETWLYPHPVPLLRLSAQLYNDIEQYQRLVGLLTECLRGR